MMNWKRRIYSESLAFCLIFIFAPSHAFAVASFARQTGLACSACHTTIPELTPMGRTFKLYGYTMTGMQAITSKNGRTTAGLNLNSSLPLSAFFKLSNTVTQKPQPGTQNGSFEFPQEISLFLAGAMSTHSGGFVQLTFDGQDDHFGMDMVDLRYANSTKLAGKDLVYGVSLNNSPTVEDLWNSTPSWGFPWVSTDVAPSPMAATLIDGTLDQDVAGLGAYAMWNNHLYGAVTAYRSEHIGAPQPSSGEGFGINIRGVAPYWRLAWQQTMGNNYLEFGTYGIHVRSSPNTVLGLTDRVTDVAADMQYERILPTQHNNLVTVHSTYIHETSALNATFAADGAAFPQHHLNTFRLDGTYHFGNKYAATLGSFATWGTPDPTLFAQAPLSGSANGDPKSDGYIANFSYWPVQNVQLGAQYTGYAKFNGLGNNYDGAGRNASDNNSLYLMIWFIF
ncbi:MAG TPA: cytochrome C [Terriglobia bacterium]|nr:cytochrome C [Terriglobia bacterium]